MQTRQTVRSRGEQILTATLTVAAVIMAVAIVKREFWPAPAAAARPIDAIHFDSAWRADAAPAIVIGDSAAPLQLVEFIDFECPVCRGFHQGALQDLRRRFGDSLAVRYVHFPLVQHRFARITAQAVECADRGGLAREMIDLLFLHQDSLGIKSWGSFAHDSGVRDTAAFGRCVRANPAAARIDSGHAMSRSRNIRGTPSFILNGWVVPSARSSAEFIRVAEAILAGKDPTR